MKLKGILIGSLVVGSLVLSYKELSKNYISEKDFRNCEWIKYNNDGEIWTEYSSEKIKQNRLNWNSYNYFVNEKNDGNLEGEILLPDLDKDGKVGKSPSQNP